MRLYAVRLKESKEAVALLACKRSELFWLIYEYTTPYVCEYKAVPNGGIYWPGADFQMRTFPDDDAYAGSLGEVGFTEAAFEGVMTDEGWREIGEKEGRLAA